MVYTDLPVSLIYDYNLFYRASTLSHTLTFVYPVL